MTTATIALVGGVADDHEDHRPRTTIVDAHGGCAVRTGDPAGESAT